MVDIQYPRLNVLSRVDLYRNFYLLPVGGAIIAFVMVGDVCAAMVSGEYRPSTSKY